MESGHPGLSIVLVAKPAQTFSAPMGLATEEAEHEKNDDGAEDADEERGSAANTVAEKEHRRPAEVWRGSPKLTRAG